MSSTLERGTKMIKNNIVANAPIDQTLANHKTQYRKRILKFVIIIFVSNSINTFLNTCFTNGMFTNGAVPYG
jgi:hypothetical protein